MLLLLYLSSAQRHRRGCFRGKRGQTHGKARFYRLKQILGHGGGAAGLAAEAALGIIQMQNGFRAGFEVIGVLRQR